MSTQLTVRKSGGSTIVSLPKLVLETLHIHAGTVMNLSIEDNRIILTSVNDPMTLEGLLENYSREDFVLTEEDHEWVHAKSKGKEF